MTSRLRHVLPIVALLAGAMFLAAATAQNAPKEDSEVLKALHKLDKLLAQDAAKDGDKAEKTNRSIREQDIYIPYEKLRQVFEKHGRGVFLPYEKFHRALAGRAGEDPAGRRPQAARGRADLRNRQPGDRREGRGPGEGQAPDRGAGRGLDGRAAAAQRRRHHRGHARRQARPHRRRGGPGLPAAHREEGEGTAADDAGPGIRPGDLPVAGHQQRLVPGPAGPGEPVASGDSAGRREGESPPADRRHGSPRRGETRPRREEARRNGRAGVRRHRPRGANRLDAQGRRGHRPGRLDQRSGRRASLDHRRGRPVEDHAGLLDQPGRVGPIGDRRAGRPEGRERLRRQCPPVVGRAGGGRSADHRPTVRARQRFADGHGRVGEARPREGPADDFRARGQGGGGRPAAGRAGGPGGRGHEGRGRAAERALAGRCRRVAPRAAAHKMDLRLPLRRSALRANAQHREGAAADRGRFAPGGGASARAAGVETDGGLHD